MRDAVRHPLAAALLVIAPAMALGTRALGAQTVAPADTGRVGDLPVVEVRHTAAGPASGTLAVLLTGDGDWADLVQTVSRTLAASGADVVVLKARAYLSSRTATAESSAADVARLARTYGARWGTRRVALVGYSRGADMLPFVATRLPEDVRRRVGAAVMFGLATRASFEFHWADLVKDTNRPTDLAIGPELPRMRAALREARLVCVYGDDEKDSGCRDADPGVIMRIARSGQHHFDGDYAGLGRVVLDALAGTAAASTGTP